MKRAISNCCLLSATVLAAVLVCLPGPAAATVIPPQSPANVTATADNEAAYVSWSAPAVNGGAPVDGYKVVAVPSGTGIALPNGAMVVAPCGQCTTVYFTGLTNGASYRFAVYAHNSAGYSLAPATSAQVAPQAPPEPAPANPSNVLATPNGTSATISWTPPTSAGDAPIDRYVIQAYDDTLSVPGAQAPYYAGAIYACATCTSATFNGLTSGDTYHFAIAAHNQYSYGRSGSSNSIVPTDPSCPLGQMCLTVDGTSDQGPIAWRADGFLHGMGFATSTTPQGEADFSYTGPDPGLVQALRPQQWRTNACTFPGGLGDPSDPNCQWITANTSAATTDVISDTYGAITYNDFKALGVSGAGAGALPPWECWRCYAAQVQAIVSHTATNNDSPSYLGSAVSPTYWDIQNEPPSCCGGQSYYGAHQDGTTALSLQQFKTAYQAIKAVEPSAQIVGPSLADFTDTSIQCDAADHSCAPGYGSNDPHTLGLDSFLPYAVGNGLNFTAISWHDNGPSEDTPNVIGYQMSQFRWLLSEYGAGSLKAFVNEYGPEAANLIPGWSAGWIAALEGANVDAANRTCWPEKDQEGNTYGECSGPPCRGSALPGSSGTLDGLFTSPCLLVDPLAPDGNYWVYDYYASMSGERVSVGTSDQTLTALATKTDASGEMQVLLGRHETCTPAQNPSDCSPSSRLDLAMLPTPPPANVEMTVDYPYAAPSVNVSIADIPNSSGPVSQPTPSTQTLPVNGGVVKIPITAMADGDAYTVTITPAS
jgi:hypothetical protein